MVLFYILLCIWSLGKGKGITLSPEINKNQTSKTPGDLHLTFNDVVLDKTHWYLSNLVALWCVLQNELVFFITRFAAAIKKQKGEPVVLLMWHCYQISAGQLGVRYHVF